LFLQQTNHALVRQNLPSTLLGCADAALWLEAQPPHSIGFFALSNILEVATPTDELRLMRAVARAAKADALVCLRSIFPASLSRLTDMQKSLPAEFPSAFEVVPSAGWERSDRSFFCKNLRVLRVRSA
jgi:hypothetical protein